jgi:hypothetical protein
MSIIVPGSLTISRKSGKRGDFNVGDLLTEIGEFEVKDALIEEFDPGKYTGRFALEWIAPESFTYRGRVFIKNRARLAEVFIDQGESGDQPKAEPPEPDPIDTEAKPVAKLDANAAGVASNTDLAPAQANASDAGPNAVVDAPLSRPSAATQAPAPAVPASTASTTASTASSVSNANNSALAAPSEPGEVDPDKALFGAQIHALVAERATVKLDPTVNREQFRAQRDQLKALGYHFDPKDQTWVHDDALDLAF